MMDTSTSVSSIPTGTVSKTRKRLLVAGTWQESAQKKSRKSGTQRQLLEDTLQKEKARAMSINIVSEDEGRPALAGTSSSTTTSSSPSPVPASPGTDLASIDRLKEVALAAPAPIDQCCRRSTDPDRNYIAVLPSDQLREHEEGYSVAKPTAHLHQEPTRITECSPRKPILRSKTTSPSGNCVTCEKPLTSSSNARYGWFGFLLLSVACTLLPVNTFWRQDTGLVHPDSVYVPGAGFSGFWFTLGRLQSISKPKTKEYYCFSAGCLGVVATLSNFTRDQVLELALDAQDKWKAGDIDRYQVVGKFVDDLLENRAVNASSLLNCTGSSCVIREKTQSPMDDPHLLSRIHVITSVKSKWFGLRTEIRNAKNTEELREMLLQTTWIPFATGSGLWHADSQTGEYHMDGGVSILSHPRCKHVMALPWMMELFLNAINVNLGISKVEKYWNAGLAFGL